jgi:hypothetical protein
MASSVPADGVPIAA